MGAELGRKRAGKKTQTGMSDTQLSEFATKPKGKGKGKAPPFKKKGAGNASKGY